MISLFQVVVAPIFRNTRTLSKEKKDEEKDKDGYQ
jgi:hypothetical protein